MIGVTAFYLAASAVALWVAALSHVRDRRHAVQIAAVLALSCACYNSTLITQAWGFWRPMDAITAWFVAIRCRRDFRPWKLLIVLSLAAQMVAHWRWQVGDKFGGSPYAYHFVLNRLFEIQLLAVASSGSDRVRGAVRKYVADRVAGRSGRRAYLLHRAACVRPTKQRRGRR